MIARVYGQRSLAPRVGFAFALLCSPALYATPLDDGLPSDLTEISLESLADIEVTAVSRRAEKLSGAPAAAYVLTGEEIRRSGARNLPEALRLIPGLTVARRDAHTWSVTARGFNSLSDKLEVLMDGRSLYTPLFSGVFWDAQDTFLPDIDRIEVIRGPGATLWGANAVNGVINIVTKSAADTQGGILEAAGGDEYAGGGARFGGKLGDSGNYRVYAKTSDYDDQRLLGGGAANDAWDITQGGFRTDWRKGERDQYTVQGDVYEGNLEGGAGNEDTTGGNLIGRWTRALSETASWTAQLYVDHTERDVPGFFHEERDTLDLDVQHQFRWREGHDVTWGGGYRLSKDEIVGSPFLLFVPEERDVEKYSLFLQDQIEVIPDLLRVTVGSKFEHNDFTGFEIQPSARFAYTPDATRTIWGAISRAVRTPNRLDHDLLAPTLSGSDDFDSEVLIAYELGYRVQPREDLSLDFAAYYHDYDELRGVDNSTLPPEISNEGEGQGYGLETAVQWRPATNWRLNAGYTYQHADIDPKSGSTDTTIDNSDRLDPHHQVFLRAGWDIRSNWTLDGTVRRISGLPDGDVPSYEELDLRLGWQFSPQLELAVTGHNLLNDAHQELGGASPVEIERSVIGSIAWRFK